MIRLISSFLLFVALALGQYTAIQGTDYPANSLGILNAKPTMRTGVIAPTGNCTAGLDLYVDTAAADLYYCGALNVWTKAGKVASVFGRTGAVTANTGDYTAAQVTNAVDSTGAYVNPSWITSLAWAKLTGVPSTFTPSAHTHIAADTTGGVFDVSLIPDLSAAKIISGTMALARLAQSGATTNQAIIWNGAAWVPGTVTGSGATSLSAITDFASTRTSATVMTVNAAATTGSPVIARIGGTAYPFTAPGTVTLSGTACTGTVYVYVSSAGALTAGHNALTCTFTGSGISIATPITGFPVNSIPLAILTITSGAWDTTITDRRAFLSGGKTFTAGAGVTLTETATDLTIASTGTGYSTVQDEGTPLTQRSTINFTGAGVSATDSGGVTTVNIPGGGSSFDPTDRLNVFFRWRSMGYNNRQDWAYGGSCTDGGTKAATTVDFSTVIGSTNGCYFLYSSGFAGFPSFPSGTANWTVHIRAGVGTKSNDVYVGVVDNFGISNFVGCQYLHGSTTWRAVVYSGGSVSGSASNISGSVDTNDHWFTISRSGTEISCAIDGGTASTTSGATVPTFSNPLMGTWTTGSTTMWHREGLITITGRSM